MNIGDYIWFKKYDNDIVNGEVIQRFYPNFSIGRIVSLYGCEEAIIAFITPPIHGNRKTLPTWAVDVKNLILATDEEAMIGILEEK